MSGRNWTKIAQGHPTTEARVSRQNPAQVGPAQSVMRPQQKVASHQICLCVLLVLVAFLVATVGILLWLLCGPSTPWWVTSTLERGQSTLGTIRSTRTMTRPSETTSTTPSPTMNGLDKFQEKDNGSTKRPPGSELKVLGARREEVRSGVMFTVRYWSSDRRPWIIEWAEDSDQTAPFPQGFLATTLSGDGQYENGTFIAKCPTRRNCDVVCFGIGNDITNMSVTEYSSGERSLVIRSKNVSFGDNLLPVQLLYGEGNGSDTTRSYSCDVHSVGGITSSESFKVQFPIETIGEKYTKKENEQEIRILRKKKKRRKKKKKGKRGKKKTQIKKN